MSQLQHTAASLAVFLEAFDAATESEITNWLKKAACAIDDRQQHIESLLKEYRNNVPERPSEEEFYSLCKLIFGPSRFFGLPALSFFSSGMLENWEQGIGAPHLPERRHIMLLLLDVTIQGIYVGAGRLDQSLQRAHGGDLLPARDRLHIGGVTFPAGVSGDVVCSEIETLRDNELYSRVSHVVSDMTLTELLLPATAPADARLTLRLRQHPGLGQRTALKIIDWFIAAGCDLPAKL